MACKYIYRGVEYTKEQLVELIMDNALYGATTSSIFKSVGTQPRQAGSQVYRDTMTLLYQRKADAENIIKALQLSKESPEEKVKKKAFYRNVIRGINKQISEVREQDADKQLDAILDIALQDAKMVQALYGAPTIAFNELQFANNVVETWLHLQNELGIVDLYSDQVDPGLRERVQEINAMFNNLNGRTRGIAIQLIKKSSKGKLTEKEITEIVDTTILTEFTRELGTAGVPLTNRIAYLIKEVNLKINMEHRDNWEMIDKMTKGIKDFSIFIKKQKDRMGRDTLALVTRYSQSFWEARRAVRNKLSVDLEKANGDPSKKNQAWKEYHKWNEKNTIAFNGLLFINRDEFTDQQREDEVKRMRALGFKDSEINDIIAESIKRAERFQARLIDFEEEIRQAATMDPSVMAENQTVEEFVKMKVEEYDKMNNPLTYMRQKFFEKNNITAYGGARFTYLIPVKTIDGKDSGYYDANFIKISNDPKLYAFYSWFTKFMEDNLSWLPQDEMDELQSNFLPVIADRLAKEYGITSLRESVNGLGDWFMKLFSVSEFENKVEVNPYSRKERRAFKARFLNESIPVEERSTDLNLVAKLFSDMALVYKHKNTIRAEIDTLNDMLQSVQGSYKVDKKLGIKIAQDKKPGNIQRLSDWTVRTGFYGIKSEDTLPTSDQLFYDWKELIPLAGYQSEKAKQAQKIQEQIKLLNEELIKDGITEEDKKTMLAKREVLIQDYYRLGGRRLSLTKAIDSSISNTRLTALGFAPFSAIRNLLVGKINNRIHAAGGRDYSKTELSWANGVLKQSVVKYWSGGKYETSNTRKLFGILADSGMAEGEDSIYAQTLASGNTTIDKIRELLPKAYTWLSGGDYHFKAEMTLAAMKFTKVKTAKGESNLWDVMTADRKYNEAEFGAWDAAANEGMTFEEFYIKNMLKYRQLANKLHGATGKDIYVKGKDTAIGRILFLFKSWLPETVGARFDPRHTDGLLERSEEGYYRTFGRLLVQKKLGAIMMVIDQMLGRKLELTDEMELANFKKAVKELQYIVGVWTAYVILKAMAPDDEDDRKIYNVFVLRQLHDLGRDLTYYSNISSFQELQKSPVSILRTFINWGQAGKAVMYYSAGIENEDGDLVYDEERTALKITKVLPVLSNTNRVLWYARQID